MKTTKSGKPILTAKETTEKQRQEMVEAKKYALLQESQRQKRLWYLPMIWECVVLVSILTAMYVLVFLTGYLSGTYETQAPVVIY
jgi:phage baseplate assembly protein gpV